MSFRALWQTLNDPTRCAFSRCSIGRSFPWRSCRRFCISGSHGFRRTWVICAVWGCAARREGKRTYYSLVKSLKKEARQILESALLTLAEVSGAKGDAPGLKLVLEKRRSVARDYFNRVAGRLGKSFCPGRTWTEIGPLLAQLVPRVVVADLGAGEGWLSQCWRSAQRG